MHELTCSGGGMAIEFFLVSRFLVACLLVLGALAGLGSIAFKENEKHGRKCEATVLQAYSACVLRTDRVLSYVVLVYYRGRRPLNYGRRKLSGCKIEVKSSNA